MRHDGARWATTLVIWLLAGMAAAQDVIGAEEYAKDRDWMTSGLAPLVLLLGIGLAIALIAAGIAAVAIAVSRRRRFGGPREA